MKTSGTARGILALAACTVAALAAAATGCAGSGTGAPKIESFTATPDALPYGGGAVTFHWKVSGAKTLDIEPGVGVVTGTAATVTLTTGGDYTLTATRGNDSASAVTTVFVAQTISLHGTVSYQNIPIPGVSVLLLGKPGVAPVATDSAGHFSIDGVVPPYDVGMTIPGSPVVAVYRGLTRVDPWLETGFLGPPGIASAHFSGTLAGAAGFPEASGTQTYVSAWSPTGFNYRTTANTTSSAWTVAPQMLGSRPGDFHLHAIEFTNDASGHPVAFPRYGNLDLPQVAPGATISGQDIALTPVPNTIALTGTLAVPATLGNFAAAHARIDYAPGPSGFSLVPPQDFIEFPGFTVTSGTFALHAPQIPNTAIDVYAEAYGPSGDVTYLKRGVSGSAPVTIDLPDPTVPVLPPPNAVISTNTTFVWSVVPDSVTLMVVQPSSTPGPELFLFQAGASGTPLPDLSELGFSLVPGGDYFWYLYAFGPYPTIDDACGPGGILSPMGDVWGSFSYATPSFTVAP